MQCRSFAAGGAVETGTRVLLNEAFAVTDSFGFDKNGPVVRITECSSDGRLRVGNETGISDAVVVRSSLLAKEKLKPGSICGWIRINAWRWRSSARRSGWIGPLRAWRPIPWNHIGGQQEAVQAIRDSIELPFLHAHLFKRFNHPVPKGFLLYGPPVAARRCWARPPRTTCACRSRRRPARIIRSSS